jgi:exodeoxyribonuclease VII large subunit
MESPRAGQVRVLRVGELVATLSEVVADALGRVWVVGELSNLRRAASGHLYFTLKDDGAQLRAVLFRGDALRLRFEPTDGLEVLAFGEVSVYGARGELQLVVRQLEPRGQGALRLAFEQLRARLEQEGLFAASRKRPLPRLPRAVGVVTSAQGAAVRDVIEVTGARCLSIPLLVAAARVQGDGADLELVEALQLLSARPEVDVILLVRGGGSLEDLWCFNSESLARAIARCPVPVVAGVGHETDVTIADWVADARAPTPSAAAALVVPDGRELAVRLARARSRLRGALSIHLGRARTRLAAGRTALRHTSPMARLVARRERLAREALRLAGAMRLRLERGSVRLAAGREALRRPPLALVRARAGLAVAAGRLDTLSPLAVLGRGYAIARRAADGRIVRDPTEVAPGERLAVRVAAGEIDASVVATRPRRES